MACLLFLVLNEKTNTEILVIYLTPNQDISLFGGVVIVLLVFYNSLSFFILFSILYRSLEVKLTVFGTEGDRPALI